MDLQTAAVAYRLTELRRLARTLRWERRFALAHRGPRFDTLRIAVGRRLVALGMALLDGVARTHAATR